eukprot:Rmarinus@m.25059
MTHLDVERAEVGYNYLQSRESNRSGLTGLSEGSSFISPDEEALYLKVAMPPGERPSSSERLDTAESDPQLHDLGATDREGRYLDGRRRYVVNDDADLDSDLSAEQLRRVVLRLQAKVETLQEDKREAANMIASLERQAKEGGACGHEEELKRLRARVAELEKAVDEEKRRNLMLLQQETDPEGVASMAAELRHVHPSVSKGQELNKQLRNQLIDLQKSLQEREFELAETRDQYETQTRVTKVQLERLKEQVESLTQAKDVVTRERDSLAAEAAGLRQKVSAAEASKVEWSRRQTELQDAMHSLESQRDEYKASVSQLRSDLDSRPSTAETRMVYQPQVVRQVEYVIPEETQTELDGLRKIAVQLKTSGFNSVKEILTALEQLRADSRSLQAWVTDVQEDSRKAALELTTARAEHAFMARQVVTMREELETSSDLIAELQGELTQSSSSSRNAMLKDQIKGLKDALKRTYDHLSEARDKEAQLEAQVSALASSLAESQKMLEDAKASHEEAVRGVAPRKDAVGVLQDDLERERKLRRDAVDRANRLQAQIATILDHRGVGRSKGAMAVASSEPEVNVEAESLQKMLNSANEAVEQLREKYTLSEKTLAEIAGQLEAALVDARYARASEVKIRARLNELIPEIEKKTHQVRSLEAQLASVTSDLELFRGAVISGAALSEVDPVQTESGDFRDAEANRYTPKELSSLMAELKALRQTVFTMKDKPDVWEEMGNLRRVMRENKTSSAQLRGGDAAAAISTLTQNNTHSPAPAHATTATTATTPPAPRGAATTSFSHAEVQTDIPMDALAFAQHGKLSEELVVATRQKVELQVKLNETEDQLKTVRMKLASLQKERTEILSRMATGSTEVENKLTESRIRIRELEESLKRASSDYSTKREEILSQLERAHVERNRLQDRLDTKREELEKVENTLRRTQVDLEKTRQSLVQVEDMYSTSRREISERERVTSKMHEHNRVLSMTLGKLQSRSDNTVRDLQNEVEFLRGQLRKNVHQTSKPSEVDILNKLAEEKARRPPSPSSPGPQSTSARDNGRASAMEAAVARADAAEWVLKTVWQGCVEAQDVIGYALNVNLYARPSSRTGRPGEADSQREGTASPVASAPAWRLWHGVVPAVPAADAPVPPGGKQMAEFVKSMANALEQAARSIYSMTDLLMMHRQARRHMFLKVERLRDIIEEADSHGETLTAEQTHRIRSGLRVVLSSMLRAGGIEQAKSYALGLGLDPEEHRDLLWIADDAIDAPLPDGWVIDFTSSGAPAFVFTSTGKRMQRHPLDPLYRNLASALVPVRKMVDTVRSMYPSPLLNLPQPL